MNDVLDELDVLDALTWNFTLFFYKRELTHCFETTFFEARSMTGV